MNCNLGIITLHWQPPDVEEAANDLGAMQKPDTVDDNGVEGLDVHSEALSLQSALK